MTVVYRYRNNIYFNITNRCQVACVFCIRLRDDYRLGQYNMRLEREPTVDEILRAFESVEEGFPDYEEIVFCGMGEPLVRLDAVLAVAATLTDRGRPIRVDTNGLANLSHGRDVTPELSRVVDVISISLNAGNPQDYAQVCPSPWGEQAFPALLEFIRLAKKRFKTVQLSTVHPNAYAHLSRPCPIDLDECRRLARSFGLPLRIRGQ